MTYLKNFIGKGKSLENLPIVVCTINMNDAENHIFEFEGKRYLRFEVAPLRTADKFNRTHTCYISQKQTVENAKPKRKSKTLFND